MHFAASNRPDLSDPQLRGALRKAGLPVGPKPGTPLPQRVLTSGWLWLSLVLLAFYAYCAWDLWQMTVPDRAVPGGRLIGLGTDAIEASAIRAAYTVVPLTLIFLAVDRFRRWHLWIWLLTFGWGALASTWLSMHLNTWAAAMMNVAGNGDPAAAARPAVFIAPFVEEAAKASILFFIAIFLRNRWVSMLSGITLAGLSASAFAFTENIVYYGRAFRSAIEVPGVDPEAAVDQLFMFRGVATFFGHPLFTSMTGIGLAVALRARSKTVRVMAPLVGFLAAAFLHMMFNGTASIPGSATTQLGLLMLIGWPMTVGLLVFSVRQILQQRTLIEQRLTDYQVMGWLPENVAPNVAKLTRRFRVRWQAFWGPKSFLATVRLQNSLTELAYLRDAIVRGLVDETGLVREKQLLYRARALRERALIEPEPKTSYPWERSRDKRKQSGPSSPEWPGPAGLAGVYPAPTSDLPGSRPLGSGSRQ